MVHARLMSPNGIDLKLFAADCTLVFAFTFARTLSTILTSADFPGWLAPITADPVRLSTTMQFASFWSAFWVVAAVVFDAFDPNISDEARSNVGPVNAAASFVLAAALYVLAALSSEALLGPEMQPSALALCLDNAVGALGLGLSLIAWRAFFRTPCPVE